MYSGKDNGFKGLLVVYTPWRTTLAYELAYMYSQM